MKTSQTENERNITEFKRIYKTLPSAAMLAQFIKNKPRAFSFKGDEMEKMRTTWRENMPPRADFYTGR